MDFLEKYIPELNVTNTEELLTCKTCLDGMRGVSNFLRECVNVEERISKYTEIERKDDKGQIELQDVQQFIFEPTLKFESESYHLNELGQTSDGIQEEFTMKTEDEVKCETEVDIPEIIQMEHIKSERNNYDSFLVPPADHLNSLDISVYKCETTSNMHLNDHTSTPKSHPATKIFKCELCKFETKHKPSLKRHKSIIHSPTLCKCNTYETNYGPCLKHTFFRKPSSGVTKYKCDICEYETKYLSRLNEHKLIHKDPSEITKFKCELCPVEVKRKRDLNRHITFTHSNPSEKTLYKCRVCPYETRHTANLKRHEVSHKSPSETPMFKCEMCTFETKHEANIKRHLFIHKNPSEIKKYKCDTCPYEAKRRRHLNEHKMVHKDPLEVTMFKCELCAFKAKHKRNLNRHMSLFHKDPSETTVYKCASCTYETRHKHALIRHLSIHKRSSKGIADKCKYETKSK